MKYRLKITEKVRAKLHSLPDEIRQEIGYRHFRLEENLLATLKN